MDPIPQLLINLALRYEPNAIKKNTFQYVKYFIHLMDGHLSFRLGKHGLMILDKDGNLFPYLKFIKFLQLDLKEMFDTFRNNKNPQISSSQWNESYQKLYDKANPVPPPEHRYTRKIEQKQIDIIIDECIQEIKRHPNITSRNDSNQFNIDNIFPPYWNTTAWVVHKSDGVHNSCYKKTELYSESAGYNHFQWRVTAPTEDKSFEKITEEVKEIESKYKQKINQMKSSMKDEEFRRKKFNSIISYMKGVLFNSESEMDNTFSQGTHKNGYVRKIKGGLEGEFNYKFNNLENIRKFLKEIEMYLK
tara:strand:- start:90 stop:1001 length:912 start_codon:yes stop_codon:yes gene_type:complete